MASVGRAWLVLAASFGHSGNLIEGIHVRSDSEPPVMHLGTIGITQKAKYMRSRRRSRWCAHMHVLHGRTPNSHSVFGFIYVLVDCARFRLPTRVESNVRLNGRRSAALCVC